MKVKLLLINAIDITKSLQTSLPPLSLGYLASALRSKFGEETFEFKIIDRDVEEAIEKFRPEVVGITSVSQNFNYAREYSRIAKKYNLPVLVGGTHITVLPESLSTDMDVAVLGEGEEAIKELFEIYFKNKCFKTSELKKLKGLAFWDKKRLVRTEDRPPVKNMDEIVRPARDLMKIEKCTHVFSSRGCPYRCTFCASSRFWNSTRFFSAEYVVDEIKYLYENHGVREIDFWDDLFIVNKQRIKDIIKLLKKEGLLGEVIFSCAVRSNLIDESMAKMLKELNVRGVSMGLESGNPRILNFLKGNTTNINFHQRAIRIFKKYGIEPSASFIIGSPDESGEEVMDTYKFIKDSKLRGFGVYVLTPLPGTPIWEYAKSKKLVSNKMDWSRLNVEFMDNHEKAIILSENISRDELYQWILKFRALQKQRRIIDFLKHPKSIARFAYHGMKKKLIPIMPEMGAQSA